MSEIVLGCIATDLASGLEGTLTSRVEMFNGSVQYGMQPKAAKGASAMPEPYSIDSAQLKYKAKGISDKAGTPQRSDIQIGDEVEDIVSGHKGVVLTKTLFLNGCVYFEVIKKENEAKKIESTSMFLSSTRLKKITSSAVKPLTTKGEKPVGGPTTRAHRAT